MAELNFGRLLRRTRLFHDQIAIKDLGTGHEATYAEHIERVGRLCSAIAGLGLGPTDRLAVLAGGSHVYVELWHACLAGAAIINPLNPRLAPDELVYILDDSGTEAIVVDETFAPVVADIRDRLPSLRTVVLVGDADVPADVRLDDITSAAVASLPPEPDDDAPAVLMYTGGTTGLPKGVVISQKAVMLTVHRLQTVVATRPDQSYLAFMPMFHIGGISAWGLYLPTGGRVVIQPQFAPAATNEAVRDEGITVIGAVPTMLAMMLQDPGFDPSMLASLQLIMYGAAPMPPSLLAQLMELFPGLEFSQAYGMTEMAGVASQLTAADHAAGRNLDSIGRALLGVDIEIRDPATGAHLPAGEVGEIWIRADSLLSEYWNKPEQTAASLVDGWYRSGDAARMDDHGYLFLADRVKDMIVSGGENVYSLEVEHAIQSHPGVLQVAVIGLDDDRWGERVHAVVVCEPGAVTADELDAHARRSIAGYKVPKTWTLQPDPLPMSAAAKVLKRELRERESAR